MRIQRKWTLLLGLGALAFLLGCEEDPTFSRKWRVPTLKIKKSERPVIKKLDINYTYTPQNKRDPFRPPYLTASSRTANQTGTNKPRGPLKPVQERPKTELEKYELDQLNVVALITGVANPMALLEDPKKGGHIVRQGTRIGRNGGRVTRIHSGGIVITEVRYSVTNKRFINRRTLGLKKRKTKRASGSITIGKRQIFLDENGSIRYRLTERNDSSDDL